MNLTMIFFISGFTLTFLLFMLPHLLSPFITPEYQKNISFECGMSVFHEARVPFSLRFFLLMVLFIIFDVEIALILMTPLLQIWGQSTCNLIIIFLFVLLAGTLYEMKEGSLQWLN